VKLIESRIHIEAGKYAIVGAVATVIDIALFNIFISAEIFENAPHRSFFAKVTSSAIAIVVAYLGHKLWTFSHRSGHDSESFQLGLFVLVNLGGLFIALSCLWFSRFVLGFTSQFADNVSANVVGLVLATMFRFLASRRWVFTA
jgi:putative flippase GtrA